MRFQLSTAKEIIEEARQGRMFILVDDENRENEGDLIAPAETITAEQIAFMAKKGSGLICLPMSNDMADKLELELIGQRNNSHSTAFTISIEARVGVSTGISAQDRAHTILTAVSSVATASDLATPGHVFPLRAVDGGVLERPGHTEATVDVMRLAGRQPAGVICEVMNEDGTMSRLPELLEFSKHHGLKIGTIADLVTYLSSDSEVVAALKA